jgi:hypothetical protein
MSNIKCQISNIKYQTVAAVLICLLTACSRAETPSQPGGSPTGIPGASQLPTWTPPAAMSPTIALFVPSADSLTTAQLETRLDPFGSPDCKLPCYNGLVPGQGDLQEALNFYGRLGISALDLQPGDYEAARDGTGNLGATLIRSSDVQQAIEAGFRPPQVDLRLDSNVVRSIYVKWGNLPFYLTLPHTLEVMGQPDRLDLALVFGEGNPTFVLQLIYTASQTGFAFSGEAPNDGSQVLVCLSNDRLNATMLGVFAPGEPIMAGQTYEKYLMPIQETLGLPYADIAAQAGAGGCLSIPQSLWGVWQTPENN